MDRRFPPCQAGKAHTTVVLARHASKCPSRPPSSHAARGLLFAPSHVDLAEIQPFDASVPQEQQGARTTAATPLPARRRATLHRLPCLLCLAWLALLFAGTPARADEPAVAIRYGGDRAFAPFEFLDAKGQPQGFQVELLRELARNAGLQIEIRLDDWPAIENTFRDGGLDLIAMSRTRGRGEWAHFLPHHATPALAIYHRHGERAPESLQELEQRRIAYVDFEPMRETVSDFFGAGRFRFVPHATPRAALESVRDGGADLALMLRAYGDPLVEGGTLAGVAAANFNVRLQDYAFAIAPGNDALAGRLTRALEELESSGRLEALRVKWLSSHRAEREQARLEGRIVLQWVAGSALALLALVQLVRLGRRLRARTAAMRAERTKREEAERALHVAEQRFEQSFRMHPDGMAIIEADSGLIVEGNPALGSLLGQPPERIAGQTIATLSAIDSPDTLATLRELMREAGRLEAAPIRLRRSDGALRDCVVQCDPFELEARRCVFVIVRDVSAQTQAQAAFRKGYETLLLQTREQARALAHAQQGAEAARRETARYTDAVAHDLKAPVRTIRGVTEFLRDDIARGALDSALANVERIDRAAIRMDALIGGLARLSQTEQAELRRERIDMQAAARESWELVASDPVRRVAFTLAALPAAQGDAALVQQVWQNLLGNAWKYTGRSGAPAVGVDSFVESGRTWYRVADNGAGFDMAHAQALFQPFRRMHTEREFPGTGIGLSIVQRIVHRHGGEVRARSTPGVGSIFEFTLQAQPAG